MSSDLIEYYKRQIEWSRQTFGPGLRTKGIIQHITKELAEISQDPHDLLEWVDVIILGMDGFWRHGGTAENLLLMFEAKQEKNMARTWPDWRDTSEDKAIEHVRTGEAPVASPAWFCGGCGETNPDKRCIGCLHGMEMPGTKPAPQFTDEQVKQMVDRFLGWRLPENFWPDGGITFEPMGNKGTIYEYKMRPSGTNLFDAKQAEAMVRHILGLPGTKP